MVNFVWDQCLRGITRLPPGPSSIKNDAHGIEKLLLKTQLSLTSFLQSEVNQIIHITREPDSCIYVLGNRCAETRSVFTSLLVVLSYQTFKLTLG